MAPGKGGARVVTCNRAARRQGLVVGDLLSNARSKVLDLQSRNADPAADAAALNKLALWATRYAPNVAPCDRESGAEGLFLDITGCAHLFGGEEGLTADIAGRLRRFGLAVRIGVADTAGAAWAVARHGKAERTIIASGAQAAALASLPLSALRFTEEALSLLARLGLRRIGEVMDQPRAPFATRLGGHVLLRLDQALGRAPEPLVPVVPPPVYRTQAMFLEPILSQEHVLEAARRLLHDLMPALSDHDAGARVLRLLLFRVDGDVVLLDLGLAAPSRDVGHIVHLLGLRLERLAGAFEAEFGFEAAALHVLAAEPLAARQARLGAEAGETEPDGLARLIDRLRQRLGPGAVRQLRPHQSHIPERAERRVVADALRATAGPLPDTAALNGPLAPRPLLLLPEPEAAQVVALLPDGPPWQFRWRGVTHRVADAEGPERITPEWWQRTGAAERDYYMVEDTDGLRVWLFRDGLYGGEAVPRWFVHGVFA